MVAGILEKSSRLRWAIFFSAIGTPQGSHTRSVCGPRRRARREALRAAVWPHLEMPDDARQLPQNMSPSSREPDSEDFIRRYWTALVKLRNRERTEVAEGRHLLRQMPPRPMRFECLNLMRAKQKDPEGQCSPRAPMTASAMFAPRAGASGGFHRYTSCKFPAPVLRACSSARHIQEPEDVVGCRRSSRARTASSA